MIRQTKEVALSTGGTNSSNMVQFAVSGVEDDLRQAEAILDLGCGVGQLGEFLRKTFQKRLDGMDAVRYEGFREEAYDQFILIDFDSYSALAHDVQYDIAFAIEVIEHLENPRAFVRFASQFLKPGGKLVITTPNVTSLSSLLALACQGQFRDFRDGLGMYPTHITPVLPLDACRILTECGLEVQAVTYSHYGRVPFISRTWQSLLPFVGGALFSDNYRIIGRARNISGDEASFITRTGQYGR